jgi:hypothetical protein
VPDRIRAADPPTPLPSEVLAEQGVAGFVLRPADLDRLPTLTSYPPGDEHAACRAIQAGEREAAEKQADALRAEVARLTGLLDETREQLDAYRSVAVDLPPGASGRGLLVIPETFLPTPEHPAALRVDGPGLVEYDGHELWVTYDNPVDGTLSTATRVTTPVEALDREPVAPVVELYRDDEEQARPGLAPDPTLDEALDGSVDDDPRRPHPDSWPDDAVLLRYRELRDLVALHLDRYADARTARAMRDGDVPLRLAEVLR